MIKNLLLTICCICFFSCLDAMTIKYFEQFEIEVEILSPERLAELKTNNSWQASNELSQQLVARTMIFGDGRIAQEFFDRKGILFQNREDFQSLGEVKYIKNRVPYLRSRISYVFDLDEAEANRLKDKGKLLSAYLPEHPDIYSFELYRLENGQVLYLYKEINSGKSEFLLYEDIDALAFDQYHIYRAQFPQGAETGQEAFIQGYISQIYNHEHYYVIRSEIESLIKNHCLQKIDSQLSYLGTLVFDLYQSNTEHYFLIQDIDIINKHTNAPSDYGEVYFFDSKSSFEEKYQLSLKVKADYKNNPNVGYGQSINKGLSDLYGESFPENIDLEFKKLVKLLNLEDYDLKYDETSMKIIDEALLWNCMNPNFLDQAYTPVVAFVGQYMVENKMGKWNMQFDSFLKSWNPQVLNQKGKDILPTIGIFDSLNEPGFISMQMGYYFLK